jgi:polyhydroxybutyrate depolymerase
MRVALLAGACCAAYLSLPGTAHPETQPAITKPGDYRLTIQHDGRTRMYRMHVPAGYDPAVPVPLLFALHGGGGSMDYQANDAYYGQITQSNREGFVVVFPNGYSKRPDGTLATWNAGNCCAAARDENVDDVGFVRQIVAKVTREVNIDRNRVYATGMSNGAMMAYRLACEMPDVFKAIAPVAGTDNTRTCRPSRPVSILHIHAKDDDRVLFAGGAGPAMRARSMVTDFTSVPDTVSKWVRLNGCAPTPRRILEKAGAYCDVYSSCQGNTQVQLCVTETGGHSWPGGKKPRGGEPPSQAISANDVMWDFFNRR